jgi:hypothetical protein
MVFLRYKADGISHRLCSSCAPYAVDIVFGVYWKVKIYHVRNTIDIYASGRDIGSY